MYIVIRYVNKFPASHPKSSGARGTSSYAEVMKKKLFIYLSFARKLPATATFVKESSQRDHLIDMFQVGFCAIFSFIDSREMLIGILQHLGFFLNLIIQPKQMPPNYRDRICIFQRDHRTSLESCGLAVLRWRGMAPRSNDEADSMRHSIYI